jgi:hypothetical protein
MCCSNMAWEGGGYTIITRNLWVAGHSPKTRWTLTLKIGLSYVCFIHLSSVHPTSQKVVVPVMHRVDAAQLANTRCMH